MARRRSFDTNVKREATNLALKESYSVAEGSRYWNIFQTALRLWIDPPEGERPGVIPKAL